MTDFAYAWFDGTTLTPERLPEGRRLRLDARMLDGEPVEHAYAHVCALTDDDAALRYDEPEVQQVRRDALAWWIPMLGGDLVSLSTFALDASRCAGAVTVARRPDLFGSDPFARLFPGTVVETSAVRRRAGAARAAGRALCRRAVAGREFLDKRANCRHFAPGRAQ